jgi:hypothetical protein
LLIFNSDLANEISSCPSYDSTLLHSPTQPGTPAPKLSKSKEPLARAMPMAVTILVTHISRVNWFIDDLINVFLDTEENRRR